MVVFETVFLKRCTIDYCTVKTIDSFIKCYNYTNDLVKTKAELDADTCRAHWLLFLVTNEV